jgi:hypothetical protein
LDTDVKQEVVLYSIARINVPREFYMRNYQKEGMNLLTVAADAWGEFGNLPKVGDVADLMVTSGDLKEMVACKPGKCKVKAPASAMEKFSRLDTSTPDFESRANALVRKELVAYVEKYQKIGNSALVEYQDKDYKGYPLRLEREFEDLLENATYLQRHVPELYRYLMEFPDADLPGAKNSIYWINEHFGGKIKHPVISINHLVFYEPQDTLGFAISASKLLGALHYFEAALSVTVMLDDPENNGSGFYLLHIKRMRIDALRKIPGFFARIVFREARNLVHRQMTTVKKNIEIAHSKKF